MSAPISRIGMAATRMSIPASALGIASDLGPGGIVIQFRGTADMNAIDPLDAYLTEAHERAVAAAVSQVVVDFRDLEFMNSSCFRCFVTWLCRVQEMVSGKRYRIVFRCNQSMHWQRRSLNALRCFAMDVVTIENAP